jgi:beta-glucosidase-like glycosyl hydrolase/CubicO group peptidase (beta-lactamase class C family)
MNNLYKSLIVLIAVLILVPHSFAKSNHKIHPEFMKDSISWADSVLSQMSLEEKIGQLFMVAAYSNRDNTHIASIESLIKKYHIGGLIFFQGGPLRQTRLVNRYQELSKYPLLMAMDAEWGPSMRLDSTIRYPRQMLLGAIDNNRLVYDMGSDIGDQLKRLGIHINFAPVVDVNNNAANPVINSRSFGENKLNVTNKSLAYMMGMQDRKVLATAKHFPGHGDTDTDSHHALPMIMHSRERIDSLELYPFTRLIDNGVGGVMVAHLNIPSFGMDKNEATTLNRKVVQETLKDSLGFKGLVFTDALNMKGVSAYHKAGEVEVKAFLAGNDVLLFPLSVPKAVSRIKKELRKGSISKEELDRRVLKILKVKEWNTLQNQFVEEENLYEDLNSGKFLAQRNELIRNAITLVKNENELLPLVQQKNERIASLALGVSEATSFQDGMERYGHFTQFQLNDKSTAEEIQQALDALEAFDIIICSVHNTNRNPRKNFGVKGIYSEWIKKLTAHSKVVVNVFANPYSLKEIAEIKNVNSIVVSYNDWAITQDISSQALFGAIPYQGKLPVGISESIPTGAGINTNVWKLFSYGAPEEVQLSSDSLAKIEQIVQDAIDMEATPGCQVLVARHGKVVYHKGFGYKTYSKKEAINTDHIYDIASITKVAATMPAIMRLYEENKLSLESELKDFYPFLDTCEMGDAHLSDILLHQAGLTSWIPFYLRLYESLYPNKEKYDNNVSSDYPFKIGNGFFMSKHVKLRDDVFSCDADHGYDIKLADNFFMKPAYQDTVFFQIFESGIREDKSYRYSDLGFYLMYKMVEKITNQKFNDYLDSEFYFPLGAEKLTFLPLQKYNKVDIVPTENDLLFRRQVLQGYVHDPGAAMMGGVCGHAGLFSNAEDLAKLMQMYLWKGEFGGKRYFQPETIDLFTRASNVENNNRRALGFDKPEMDYSKPGPTCQCISGESFGHTGFTGTMAWADPDKDIVYIFLSNRVYPDQNNFTLVREDVRTDIQEAIYNAILD